MSDHSYSNLPEIPRGLTYQPILDEDGAMCSLCQAIVGQPGVLIAVSRKGNQTYQGYLPSDGSGFCLECFQEQFGKMMLEMSERAQSGIDAKDELQKTLDNIEDNENNKNQRETLKERIELEEMVIEGAELFIEAHSELLEAASELEVNYLSERIVDEEMRSDFEGK